MVVGNGARIRTVIKAHKPIENVSRMVGVHRVLFLIARKLPNRVGYARLTVVEHVVNFQSALKAVSHVGCAVVTAVGLNVERTGVRNGSKGTGFV